jgi:hypothetical protein
MLIEMHCRASQLLYNFVALVLSRTEGYNVLLLRMSKLTSRTAVLIMHLIPLNIVITKVFLTFPYCKKN